MLSRYFVFSPSLACWLDFIAHYLRHRDVVRILHMHVDVLIRLHAREACNTNMLERVTRIVRGSGQGNKLTFLDSLVATVT